MGRGEGKVSLTTLRQALVQSGNAFVCSAYCSHTENMTRKFANTRARISLRHSPVSISKGSLFVGLLRSSLFHTLLLPKYLHTPPRNPYVVHELTRLAPRANTQTLAPVYLHVSISTGSSFFGLLRSSLFRALLLPTTYILLPETHSSSTNLPDLLHARTRKPLTRCLRAWL